MPLWAPQGRRRSVANARSRDTSFIADLRGPVGLTADDNHIYWANAGVPSNLARSIGRADLDGSNVDNDFIANDDDAGYVPVGNPRDVAVDSNHVYWTQEDGGAYSVARAELDGSPGSIDTRFIALAAPPDFMAVDVNHVYWVEWYTDLNAPDARIGRADLDGTNVIQQLVIARAISGLRIE